MRRLIPLVGAAVFVVLSCDENLPSGPQTFAAQLKIAVSHDTLVVGDSNAAQAQALDASGNRIQSLAFTWSSTDSSTVGLVSPASPDTSSGRARRLVGQRTGHANVSIALADPRFASNPISRTETVVVGGVTVLTTHDSTLNAISDTGVAVAAGLVRVNGALVPRPGEGIRWVHLGSHTATVAKGDTLRYVAALERSRHAHRDLRLLPRGRQVCRHGRRARLPNALARTFDTRSARVELQRFVDTGRHARRPARLRFGGHLDSFHPDVGGGLGDRSCRPPSSAISNPATGVMATPRLISTGNGTATVAVQALALDGTTIATDVVTETVRQVARRANVEALRALMSATDSIPVRAVARDARGAIIADATVSVASASGVTFHDPWAGPNAIVNVGAAGVLTPTITGMTLPDSNPLAPQIPVTVNPSGITVIKADTVKAGATQTAIPITIFDSTAQPAAGAPIVFTTSAGAGAPPATAVTDINGQAVVVWTPPDSGGYYTLTGIRPASGALTTLADSTGRIVVRRSIRVIPDPITSTVEVASASITAGTTTTVTVKVRDVLGNLLRSAVPADFTVTPTRGTVGAFSCSLGVCTATYTAPATTGPDSISVKIALIDIHFSPLALTIN